LIGRSSAANLVLDDEYTSGRHARLAPGPDGWILEDLGSTNGTFLGREQIRQPVPVRVGQTIRIGQTRLELER
jgi:pSer/pThr/pTyr-binding forkhead associated (FHA) protein